MAFDFYTFQVDAFQNYNSAPPFVLPSQRTYNGSRIFATVSNLLQWRQEATGDIISIEVWMPTNTSATSAIFNLRKNGANLLAGSGRPIIATGQSSSSKTGLELPAVIGDLMELSVEQVPELGIGTPIYMIVQTQVG
jgi:hypothetical protein